MGILVCFGCCFFPMPCVEVGQGRSKRVLDGIYIHICRVGSAPCTIEKYSTTGLFQLHKIDNKQSDVPVPNQLDEKA
jgi:hypothetical protein